ncbi:MAG: ABA4-like family protein [Acidobacteriota bacterium]|nr:ABA4-like family protein [Acidobacteriota bacterium]
MNAETIFSIANTMALLSWIWLAVAPRWIWTKRIVWTTIPLLLSVAYLILIVLFFGHAEGGFSSLADVMKLFTNQNVVLAGWIHYLAFDLFVGSWEVKDAQERGVSHLFVVPCLLLTFLLGPIGFLLYNIVRLFAAKGESK